MDKDILSTLINHLDSSGFDDLIFYLLKQEDDFYLSKRLSHIDDRIIENPPERFFQTAEAFFINYHPYSLYKNFNLQNLYLDDLKKLILKYIENRSYEMWLPVEGTRIYAISNYDSCKIGVSDKELLEFHEKELSGVLPSGFDVGIGSVSTILNQGNTNDEKYSKRVKNFFLNNDSGICINLSDDKIIASRFVAQREFDGIVTSPENIFHPVIKKVIDTDDKLVEFNQLINNDTRESVLEEFLYTYHDLFFGDKYDTLSTQVWLDFPEFDIGNKDRRLDIFMRNSISKDWDIYELKRSSVKLTKTKSDVPMFVSAVHDALTQLRNYKRILSQDKIKRKFEAKGIKYYNPQFNLVIGKKPNISDEKWNWLLSHHSDLNIITYDNLLESAKKRLDTLKSLIP